MSEGGLAYLRDSARTRLAAAGAMLESLPDEFSHRCLLGAEEIRILMFQRTQKGDLAQASAMVTWECIEDAAVNPLTLAVETMLRQLADLTKESPMRAPNIKIDDLALTVRARRTLALLRVESLADLTGFTAAGLLRMPNFGRTTLAEIQAVLAEYGMELNSKLTVEASAALKRAYRELRLAL